MNDDLLHELVPFHLVLDSDLHVVSIGRGIAAVLGDDFIGAHLLDHFEVKHPAGAGTARLLTSPGTLVRLAAIDGGLELRSQLLPSDGGFVLAATPVAPPGDTLPSGLLAAKHETWADHVLHAQLLVQQNRDLERLVDELRSARHDAEAASTAKSMILANVSHEIRTPMNAVLGMTSLLLSTELTPTQRDYAETVQSSASALLGLVGDLLDFARAEAGALAIEIEPVHLRSIVEDVLTIQQSRARLNSVWLTAEIDPSVPAMVMCDANRIRQVLLNLVDNAVKFTENGDVSIVVTHDEGVVTFTVSDTGIGIAPDVVPKLFNAFEQGDASTTRKFGGTGVGLALSRRLVEAMGGEISVRSTKGEGSVFEVEIPMPTHRTEVSRPLADVTFAVVASHQGALRSAQSALLDLGATPVELADARLVIVDYFRDELRGALRRIRPDAVVVAYTIMDPVPPDDGQVKWLRLPIRRQVLVDAVAARLGLDDTGKTAKEPAVERAPARILLAEDNLVNQRVFVQFLEQAGHDVVVASDGEEALDLLGIRSFDLMLLDCLMPRLDGYDVARKQRAFERRTGTPRLPIIALTANAAEEARDGCFASGMDDFLTKPVSQTTLVDTVDRWIMAAATSSAPGGQSALTSERAGSSGRP